MKRSILIGFIALFSIALIACTNMSSSTNQAKPQMSIESEAKLDGKGQLEIIGNGFQPNAEIALLFTTDDGVQSDIGYALEPSLIVGNNGDWKTKWSYGRFVKKKLIKAGVYELDAVDSEYNQLCKLSITFVE